MIRTLLGCALATSLLTGASLAQTPAKDGAEILVNTTTASSQLEPSVAALSGGGFVIAYTDHSGADGDGGGVLARIFDAAGTASGPDFVVNTTTSSIQSSPSVAALSGGGFVIAYTDHSGADGDGGGVLARIFDAAGTASGPDFVVNTTNGLAQFEPSVAALSGGGFVVTWTDQSGTGGDTFDTAIRAQRFDASGVAQGTEFLVNTTTASSQQQPSVAALSGGGFVVAYRDQGGADGDNWGVLARIFDASGTASGPDFLVNTTTSSAQYEPSVATVSGGGFVVAYLDSSGADGDGNGVLARIFDASGTASGPDFVVNTTTGSSQFEPNVSELSGGGFVVAYRDTSGADGDNWGVLAQRFDASGVAQGTEFLANTTTASSQQQPSVAALTGGGFVVAWTDSSQSGGDTSGHAVRAQRFTVSGSDNAPVAEDDNITVAEDDISTNVTTALLANDFDPEGDTVSIVSVGAAAHGGLATFIPPATVGGNVIPGNVLYSTNGAFNALAEGETGSDSFTYTIEDEGGLSATATVTVTINGENDAPAANQDFVTVTIGAGPQDLGATILANDTDPDTNDTQTIISVDNSATSGILSLNAGVLTYDPDAAFPDLALGEIAQDSFTYTIEDSAGAQASAAVTINVTGNNQRPVALADLFGTAYESSAPFFVNETGNGEQGQANIISRPDGGFIAVWNDTSPLGNSFTNAQIRYRIHDGNGFVTSEGLASPAAGQEQLEQRLHPEIIPITGGVHDGGFVVVWSEWTLGFNGVRFRRFAADGTPVDASPQAVTSSFVTNTTAVSLPDGGFAVAWAGSSQGTLIQRFDADGNALDGGPQEYQDGSPSGRHFDRTRLARLADGTTLLVWRERDAAGAWARFSGRQIDLRLSQAAPVSGPVFELHDPAIFSESMDAAINTLENGDVIAAFSDLSREGGGDPDTFHDNARDLYISRFVPDADLTTSPAVSGPPSLVFEDDWPTSNPDPDILPLPDGGFMLVFEDGDADGNQLLGSIRVYRYDAAGNLVSPLVATGNYVTVEGRAALIGDASDPSAFALIYREIVNRPAGLGGSNIMARIFRTDDAPDALAADQTHLLDVLANDSEPDGDPFGITAINGEAISEGGSVTLPSGATITLSGGLPLYDATQASFAQALGAGETASDEFEYTVADNAGADNFAWVSLVLTGVDDAPVITAPALLTVQEDSSDNPINTVSVADADSATLTVTLVAGSTLSLGQTTGLTFTFGDGTDDPVMTFSATVADLNAALATLSYTPAPDAFGDSSFTITATDEAQNSDSATVDIEILGAPDAPVANDDSFEIGADEHGDADVTAILLANDSDADGDTLTITAVDDTGTTASVALNNGAVTYTIAGEFDGLNEGESAADSFTYTISDGNGGSDSATMTVTILGVNDAPALAAPAAITVAEDSTGNAVPGVSVSDVDDSALTVSVTASSTVSLGQTAGLTFTTGDGTDDAEMVFGGMITDLNAALATLTYTPTPDVSGAGSIALSVTDSLGGTASAAVAVTITGVNDPPVLTLPETVITDPLPPVLELADLDGTNGVTFNGADFWGLAGRFVSEAGDVNGDGFDDFLISAHWADTNGTNSGSAFLIFGRAEGWPAYVQLSALDGINGVRLNGGGAGHFAGNSLSGAGDVNGDGFDDFLIGAPFAEPSGTRSGQSYLVFGRPSDWPATIELTSLDGTTGVQFNGSETGDESGMSVSYAGDVNGDNFDDILIGAPKADPNGSFSGEVYLIFGRATDWSAHFELSSIDGLNGVQFNGVSGGDYTGLGLTAGDINGDGFNDIVIGASGASGNSGSSGETYLIFGRESGWTPIFELSSLDGSNGVRFNGIDNLDFSGLSVSSSFDFNQDGLDDILIGANGAEPNGYRSGEAYLIYGNASDWPASFELAELDGQNGWRFTGSSQRTFAGYSVSSAGDFNGDTFDDVLIGAYGAPNAVYAGETYMIFGQTSGGPPVFDRSFLDGAFGLQVNGVTNWDQSGVSVSNAGDVNGDGISDILVGASHALGGNRGQAYLVFGRGTSGTTPATFTVAEDSTGNPITGISVADIDSPTVTVSLIATSTTTLGQTTGLTFTFGDGTDDPVMVFSGTVADVNAALAGLTYTPTADASGAGGITISVTDPEGASDSGFVTINITPVNDAPELTPAAAVVADEDTGPWALTGLSVTDADNDILTLDIDAGDLSLTFGDTGPVEFLLGANGDSAVRLRGNPAPLNAALATLGLAAPEHYNGTLDVTYHLSDPDGETANGTTSVTINPVNDPPAGLVMITGEARLGALLQADIVDVSDPDGLGTFSYQWRRGGVDIAGATGPSYTPVSADVGEALDVVVSWIDQDGTAESLAAQPTAPIPAVQNAPFGPSINTGSLNGTNGFRFFGPRIESVASAGDVNADGHDDFIIGGDDEAFLVFGREGGFPHAFAPNSLDGVLGVPIQGISGSRFGRSVSGGHDINGDGIDDVVIGAPFGTDAGGVYNGGTAYVIYGRNSGWPAQLNLQSLSVSEGFRIGGQRQGGQLGQAVALVPDVTGDERSDLVIGEPGGPGRAYVISGRDENFPGAILAGNPASTSVVITAQTQDWLGYSIAAAGDVDGDGNGDVIVGARNGRFNGQVRGSGIVISGAALSETSSLLIESSPAAVIHTGPRIYSSAGFSVGGLGDVNNDGFADVGIGAPFDDQDVHNGGSGFVVFGSDGGTSSQNLAAPMANTVARLTSSHLIGNLRAGWWLDGIGDINDDGIDDFAYSMPCSDTCSAPTIIVFGRASGFPAVINESFLQGGQNGFLIFGGLESFGHDVSRAGDLNGDGVADMVIAERYAANIVFGIDTTLEPEIRIPNNPVTVEEDSVSNAITGIELANAEGLNTGSEIVTLQIEAGSTVSLAPAGLGALQFLEGDGTDDAQLVAIGSLTAMNEALAGLSYTPGPDVFGTRQIGFTLWIGNAPAVLATLPIEITGSNDAPTGDVTISGALVAGETLTADTSALADADGLGPFSYEWRRDGGTIAGAMAASYILQAADAGTMISLAVSYTDGDGTAESVTSAPVGPVAASNNSPVANDDFLIVNEDSVAIDLTGDLLANDSDADGDTLTIAGVSAQQSQGSVSLQNGRVLYTPGAAFLDLAAGETGFDGFAYTVSDGRGGTDTAQVDLEIEGEDEPDKTLSMALTGLGDGSVTSAPAGVDCGASCSAGFLHGTEVTLTAVADAGSEFDGWGGACAAEAGPSCTLQMTANASASARFSIAAPEPAQIVTATLPGARSGHLGGDDITVFGSAINSGGEPAQNCAITLDAGAPATLSYQELDADNNPVGAADAPFDLDTGETRSFLFVMTPTRATAGEGEDVFPAYTCDNALSDPISGVNSVFLSISENPPPDILSIAATPTGDGIIHITDPGGVGFMAVAALNIGGGDGTGDGNEALVTVRPDTGDVVLPLEATVCELGADSRCLSPRLPEISAFIGSDPKFFAVFVNTDDNAGIPLDPANARVYLRFFDSFEIVRSTTSAAVTAPAPVSAAAALPVGRWGVLVRGEMPNGDPTLRRGEVFVAPDGVAALVVDDRIYRFDIDADPEAQPLPRLTGTGGQLAPGAMAGGIRGRWTPVNSIATQLDIEAIDQSLWGVFDGRSLSGYGMPGSWAELEGAYTAGSGGTLSIDAQGTITGSFNGCIASAVPAASAETAPGLLIATLSLSSCGTSGTYTAFLMEADGDEVRLLIVGNDRAWQMSYR